MLCQFQIYSKVIQLYIYMYLVFKFFSHLGYYRIFFNQLINFWLCWVLVAAHGLSLVAGEWGLLLWCVGFSLWWLLLLWSVGSRHVGFSSCGMWALQLWLMGSRAQAQQLWHTALVSPWDLPGSGNKPVSPILAVDS